LPKGVWHTFFLNYSITKYGNKITY
jgi:hypothetical protein